jgi:hypothetical protein
MRVEYKGLKYESAEARPRPPQNSWYRYLAHVLSRGLTFEQFLKHNLVILTNRRKRAVRLHAQQPTILVGRDSTECTDSPRSKSKLVPPESGGAFPAGDPWAYRGRGA